MSDFDIMFLCICFIFLFLPAVVLLVWIAQDVIAWRRRHGRN